MARQSPAPVAASESSSTALAMPDDVKADLLRAQQNAIAGDVEFPQVRILGAGAGKYDFPDEDRTVSEFTAVLLGAHGKNVLWTSKQQEGSEEGNRPACSSKDGKFGRPEEGFVHANLGRAADGNELVACADCKYNKFGTGAIFIPDKKPRGKAVTNKKVLYLYLPDRVMPFALELNTMSIPGFEEYIQKLTRTGTPMQTITTVFRQIVKGEGNSRYGVATFTQGGPLAADVFADVMKMFGDWRDRIEPAPQVTKAEARVAQSTGSVSPTLEEEPEFSVEEAAKMPAETGEIPF